MFSGIIASTGRIAHIASAEKGLRLTIDAGALGLDDVAIGDSIAVSGVCLTVIAIEDNHFAVDVSRETLDCTVGPRRSRRGESGKGAAARRPPRRPSGERPCGRRGQGADVSRRWTRATSW
ncbi:MAG: hypothetical protein MZV65_44150 [Chromatiales bacterium]|nr:hypothetical protein [Chromatiales bacterium]